MKGADDIEMPGKLPFEFVADDGQRRRCAISRERRDITGQDVPDDLRADMAIEQGMVESVAEAAHR